MNKLSSWFGLGSLAFVVSVAGVAACGNGDDDSGTGGGGGGGGGGSTCTTPKTSNTDGSTACEPQCAADEHCSITGVNCLDGCTSTANCDMGEYCDMTAATHDLEQTPTGLCRTPPVCTTTTADAGAKDTGASSTSGGTVASCLSGSGTMSASTSACATYQNCVISACNTQFTAALGADWQNGTIGGDCAAYYTCAEADGCTSAAQQSCSGSLTASCTTDLEAVGTCFETACTSESSACTDSAGGGSTGGGGSGGGGTGTPASCTSLVTCCRAISNTSDQQECASIASSNDDQACQSGLNMFEANDDCPTP